MSVSDSAGQHSTQPTALNARADLAAENQALREQLMELRARLEDAEEALRAISHDEVDALVIYTAIGEKVFTLQGAEHPYRVLVEAFNEGAATLQTDGTILYANHRLAEMLRQPLERVVGTSLVQWVDERDRDTVRALIDRAEQEDCRAEVHLEVEGRRIPSQFSLGVAQQDLMPLVCLVATDLTEHKRNQELLASERMARSILDQAAEALVVCDPDGRIIRASQSAHQLARGNPLLRSFDEVFPLVFSQPRLNGESFVVEQVLTGQAYNGLEAYINRSGPGYNNGDELCYLLVSGAPLRDEHARILGGVVSLVDITARIQAQREMLANVTRLEVQHHLIEQREQERLEIARDLHDGPLQELIVLSFGLEEVIMGLNGHPEMVERVRGVQQALQTQIGELRDFAGQLRPPTLSQFGIAKAILSHLDGFRRKHPGLTIEFDAEKERFPITQPMRLALYRIYQEMLNNVVRHSRATEVKINLHRVGNLLQLSIADNGVGFVVPTDWLDLARRGHLGLVGVLERAEMIGAQVEIVSQPNEGTRVTLSLPLNPPE